MDQESLDVITTKINRIKNLVTDISEDSASRQDYFDRLGFSVLSFVFQSFKTESAQILSELDAIFNLIQSQEIGEQSDGNKQ